MRILFRFLISLFVFLPFQIKAANATTPSTVTLLSTFKCISITAAYTGDDNSNNAAFFQYRLAGDTSWKDAYTPIIDRRPSITILGNTWTNTANRFQARGSIVGLTDNTSYDVKVTWSDTDGITGSASSTNTISTLSYSPPTGGGTKYVDASAVSEGTGTVANPYKTITNAITQSSAGDTILVAPGSYSALTISKSGTAANYFVLRTNGTPAATISGGSASFALLISANYWLIDGFQLAQSQFSGVSISAGNHHIYVENTLQTNAFAQTNGAIYSGGCALLGNQVHDIFLLTNNWSIYNFDITNSQNGEFDNIDISGGGPDYTLVISDNILIGGWDAIGNRNNSASSLPRHCENSDFCYNSFTNWIDDLCEFDGLGPNVRFFGNTARRIALGWNPAANGGLGGPYGGSLFSDCGSYIGPAYVFRNTVTGVYTNADGTDSNQGFGIKMGGHDSMGAAFYFHNVFRTASVAGAHELISEGGGPGCGNRTLNKVFMDNIFVSRGNMYFNGGITNIHNYNDCFKVGTADFASGWNCSSTNYASFAAFIVNSGAETNGIGSDPLLTSTLTIPTNSPAVDIGIVLTNFNDSSSFWPYAGSGPDLGAFESNGSTPAVTNATLTVTSSNPASGVTITISPVDNNSNGDGSTSFTRIYTTNVVVTLTAPATASGNNFSKWQKDGVDSSFSVGTTVQMDTGHTLSAIYVTPTNPDTTGQSRSRKSPGKTFRR